MQLFALSAIVVCAVDCFVPFTTGRRCFGRGCSSLYATPAIKDRDSGSDLQEENSWEDDKTLLRQVDRSKLVELCKQTNITVTDECSKEDILSRLRAFAEEQAELDRRRQQERLQRVADGYYSDDNSKERYEVIGRETVGFEENIVEDEDLEGCFYFELPETANVTATSRSGKVDDNDEIMEQKSQTNSSVPQATYHTSAHVTAPPIPDDVEPNEKGERVVTIYNSADQNDLTGVAAAQPGSTMDSLATSNSDQTQQPWDHQPSQTAAASPAELDKTKQAVTELVHVLLAMTGAPAFAHTFDETNDRFPQVEIPSSFVGFEPKQVPTDLLVTSSSALRADRGKVLQEVLRQFELKAIAHDGNSYVDNPEKGGGHYRVVTQIRAFLEGFRRAEVRRVARETTSMLLDKVILEGVEGLDLVLAASKRSSDDTSDTTGELNDSLLDFLDDTIRTQEQRLDQMVDTAQGDDVLATEAPVETNDMDVDTAINQLWNETVDDGQVVQSIDPNNPKVRQLLSQQQGLLDKQFGRREPLPESGPEKLLLLLKLLRDRIKVEAAFSTDEKGRNLRLLAYCLQLPDEKEREQLILKTLGSSIDRLDSFIELVVSSIEYGESTSYQLQPAKTKHPLNVRQLRSVLELAKYLRQKKISSASGTLRP